MPPGFVLAGGPRDIYKRYRPQSWQTLGSHASATHSTGIIRYDFGPTQSWRGVSISGIAVKSKGQITLAKFPFWSSTTGVP